MDNYFDRELKSIEKELTALKTLCRKSSGEVQTIWQTINVSIPLALNQSHTACNGKKLYRINLENNSIVNVTLDWYHQDITKEWQINRVNRLVGYEKIILDSGELGIQVYAIGTNYSTDASDDVSQLEQGQSINIETNMTITSTNYFSIEEV